MILTDTKNALTKQFAKLMAMEGVELEFSNDALVELAAQAIRKGTGARAKKDLVGGVASGAMTIEAVAPSELPEELRGMDKPVLTQEIARRAALRKEVQVELDGVARQRDEYLKAKARTGEGGFDDKVKAAIDAQLK